MAPHSTQRKWHNLFFLTSPLLAPGAPAPLASNCLLEYNRHAPASGHALAASSSPTWLHGSLPYFLQISAQMSPCCQTVYKSCAHPLLSCFFHAFSFSRTLMTYNIRHITLFTCSLFIVPSPKHTTRRKASDLEYLSHSVFTVCLLDYLSQVIVWVY